MRISDWSSDVCSSDLFGLERRAIFHAGQRQRRKLVEEFKKVEIELSDAIRDGIGKELLLGREIRAGRIGAAASTPAIVIAIFLARRLGSSGPPAVIATHVTNQIGRASCRERGCQSV